VYLRLVKVESVREAAAFDESMSMAPEFMSSVSCCGVLDSAIPPFISTSVMAKVVVRFVLLSLRGAGICDISRLIFGGERLGWL
jgi:hypothetical protein